MEEAELGSRKTTRQPRKQQPRKVILVTSGATPSPQQSPTKNKYCQTEMYQHDCCCSAPPGAQADLGTPVDLMEPGDPPLLQKQLQTSKSGIQQIIECFRSGTAELRHILLKEVDTIFECRQCRSLFRGLPNLVTHKEFYCFTRPNETNDTFPDRQSQAIKEFLQAIYPRMDRPDYTVRLEPIEGNRNAVFQSLATDHHQSPREEQTSSAQEPAAGPVAVNLHPVEPDAEETMEKSGDPLCVTESNQEGVVEPKGQKSSQEAFCGSKGKKSNQEAPVGTKGKRLSQEARLGLKGKKPRQEARAEPVGQKPNQDTRVELIGQKLSHKARAEPKPQKLCQESRAEPTSQKLSHGAPEKPKRKSGAKRQKPASSSDGEEECNEKGTSSKAKKVSISCCLCGKEFGSRRSVRHHCLRVHKKNMDDLKKFTETRTVPVSLVSIVRGHTSRPLASMAYGCSTCSKSFATKVGMRHHFDKEHRRLPQDVSTNLGVSLKATTPSPSGQPNAVSDEGKSLSAGMCVLCKKNYKSEMALLKHMHAFHKISPAKRRDITTKPQQSVLQKAMSPTLLGQQNALLHGGKSMSACMCFLCKRNFKSEVVLIRHMRVFHKIHAVKGGDVSSKPGKLISQRTTTPPSACYQAENSRTGSRCTLCKRNFKTEGVLVRHMRVFHKIAPNKKGSSTTRQASNVKTKPEVVGSPADTAKDGPGEVEKEDKVRQPNSGSRLHKSKLELGFDLEQHYCKLCKRQFSSRANLNKHIDRHMDGNNLFIKFFPCPQCSYETRRKRDVLRHLTVVHKKPSHYLEKVTTRLDSQVIKKPANVVLKMSKKRGEKQPGRSRIRRPAGSLAFRKCDIITRSSSTLEATKVKVTKDLSLYTCDLCGRAFARKVYLQLHRRTHGSPSREDPPGRRTRSKAVVW